MGEITLQYPRSTEGSLKMHPVSGATGIEILGVDLRAPLPEQSVSEIRYALAEWGVVFFRDQDLTPEQQIAFAHQFGKVQGRIEPSNLGSLENYPELHEIRRKPSDAYVAGGFWHSDQCYAKEPPLGSVLYARELPVSGGDTMFAHMGAVCEKLSEGLRKTLRTLRAVQDRAVSYEEGGVLSHGSSSEYLAEMRVKYAEVHTTHPVIGRHPVTGQEILFVNPAYTTNFEGWTREESRPLINHLCDLAIRPENTCRFKWQDGSLAMWDNRAVIHYAVDDYFGQSRLMHRCVIRGPWLEPA